MSRTAARAGATATGLRGVAALVFILAMALVVLLLVRARPAPEPFDPRSGRADGARGLVITLGEVGATVVDTRDAPLPGATTRVLVLEDRLDDEQRADVLDFVEAGGVAVVADPTSTLHGGSGVDGGGVQVSGGAEFDERQPPEVESNVERGSCTIAALADLRGIYVPDGVLFPVGGDEDRCFTDGRTRHSFVITRTLGRGLVVGLGDNEPFVNEHLRRADNAGLVSSLLVPEQGSTVTFLVGRGASPTVDDVGSGDETLRDLIAPWVWMALALGAIAFVVFAVSRSVRVGPIVSEPEATPIAGSELVSATGNLMERAGHATRAAWLIQGQLHRDLCRAFNVDTAAPLADLDRAVSERAGTEPGAVESALRSTIAAGGLSTVVGRTDAIRRQVFGATGSDHRGAGGEPPHLVAASAGRDVDPERTPER